MKETAEIHGVEGNVNIGKKRSLPLYTQDENGKKTWKNASKPAFSRTADDNIARKWRPFREAIM
jgi:hypothetical protein